MKNYFILCSVSLRCCIMHKPSDNNTEDPPCKIGTSYPAMIGNWAHVLRITDEACARA